MATLMLDGEVHTLRPTFAALCSLEEELGMGLVAIAEKIADGALTLKELTTILGHCLTGESPRDPQDALLRAGIMRAMNAVGAMLAEVLAGRA